VTGVDGDALADLAELLGLPEAELRAAVGGPWSRWDVTPQAGDHLTVFTGLPNPRTPGRPLVAVRVTLADGVVDVGKAVGVTVPSGDVRWSLGEPRTQIPIDADDPQGRAWQVLVELQEAVQAVITASVLRGTRW
jgi:hypothetical protein